MHMEVKRALGQFDLRGDVVEIRQAEAGEAIETYRRGADIQFSARPAVSIKLITGNQRPIDNGVGPVTLPGRQEAYSAADMTEPRHPLRRVGHGGSRAGQKQQNEQRQPDAQSKTRLRRHGFLLLKAPVRQRRDTSEQINSLSHRDKRINHFHPRHATRILSSGNL